jgi:hypothetical protein
VAVLVTPKPKRIVPDTHLVVLRGGPPEWAEHVAKVCDVPGTLERWDHAADAALVWEPTDETAQVEVDRERKGDTVRETKTAQVFRCVGYREDMLEARPEGEAGQDVRVADMPQAAPDGQLQVTDS